MPGVGWVRGYIALLQQQAMSTDMAQELYSVPASKLDSFVAQWLQPTREWKEEVLETVQAVEQFLRQENFHGERGLARDVRVLKVVKVKLDPSIPGQGRGKTQGQRVSLLCLTSQDMAASRLSAAYCLEQNEPAEKLTIDHLWGVR